MQASRSPTGSHSGTAKRTAPIEQIVEASLHYLDVAVGMCEGVAHEEGRTCRNNKGPVIKPKVIVLDLGGPVVRECPFASDPDYEAAGGVVVAARKRCAGGQVRDRKVVDVDPGAASLAIKQPLAVGPAEAGRQRRDPGIVGLHHERSNTRHEHPGAVTILVSGRINVPFDAEHEVAGLVVVADLTAADEHAVAAATEVQAKARIGDIAVRPGASDVAADIEAGPTEWRRRIDRRRR